MLKAGATVPECEFLTFPDEQSIRLQELLSKGGPLVLFFAKKSCPTCQWAFPYLDRVAGSHPELPSGRVFFVLQEDEDSETVRKVLDQYGLAVCWEGRLRGGVS